MKSSFKNGFIFSSIGTLITGTLGSLYLTLSGKMKSKDIVAENVN